MRTNAFDTGLTIFFLFMLTFRAGASEVFAPQVDIRDISKQHILNTDVDAQVYLNPPMHNHHEFNCSVLTEQKQITFCKLNNQFLYDNYSSYPVNETKLIDFRPYQGSEELFYNLYGANKYFNLERNTDMVTSIVLKSFNEQFNEFNLVAVIYFEYEVYFQEFSVSYLNDKFITTEIREPVRLAGNFKMHTEVGLFTASLLMTIEINDFKFEKVMPITAPGFNYEETSLKSIDLNKTYYLSNNKKLSKLDNNKSSKQRFKPSYYDGLPFLKILRSNNSYFLYAFHGTLDSKPLERGFLSTGCYRLKSKDIIEFYYIFNKLTDVRATTVTRKYLSKDLIHPMPMIKWVYSKAEFPGDGKGADGLTAMKRVYGKNAPIDKLVGY